MQRAYQIAALCFAVFSALVVKESLDLEYYTKLGPGAGFFPFWLAASLGILALVWLIQVSRRSGAPKQGAFFPKRAGIIKIVSILAALLAMAGLMTPIGFQLSMFLFLVFLLGVLGRQKLWMTLIIAVLGSVGVFHVFGGFLDVPLPAATIPFLANLGL